MVASQGKANLIVNGSFEATSLNYGTWATYQTIPGWTALTGSGIEVQDHAAGTPYDGDNLVELDAYSNSSMYQDVTTVAGTLYTLSFAYSPRPYLGAGSNGIQAWWNGLLLTVPYITGNGSADTTWAVYSYSVVGTGNDRLIFAATTLSDSLGGYLDDVRLNSVPDGGMTLAMLGIAMAGLAAIRRRTP